MKARVALAAMLGAGLLSAVVFLLADCRNGTRRAGHQVGVVMSLTGPGAQYGQMVLEGMKLALEEANSGRVGPAAFGLVVEDDQTEPRIGVTAAQKLISVNRVRAILGPIASSVAMAVAPLCQRNHIVLLSPAASTPELTKQGDFIMRIYPSDIYDGKFLADFAITKLGVRSASILYLNNDFGVGLKDAFVERFTTSGGSVSMAEGFPQGLTDFRTSLTKVSKAGPRVLFFIANVQEYVIGLRQMRQLGVQAQVVAPLSFDDPSIIKLAGDAAEGVIYSRPAFDPESRGSAVRSFVAAFRTRYGQTPSILNALGYDSVKLMVFGLQHSNSQPESLRDILLNVKNFPGAAGNITFDKHGDVVKQLQLMMVRKGVAEPLDTPERKGASPHEP